MSDRYAAYDQFLIEKPEDGLLRLTFNKPERYNAVDAEAHRQLTYIWRDIDADPERLVTVLEHLIRNAQDATKETGFIDVSLSADNNVAMITIADTGAGMSPEFIRERLFRPFDSTKGSQSMGIGAYQAREYVRQLGGQIDVTSAVGQGSRFEIRLPTA